jgi:hypothetical protein
METKLPSKSKDSSLLILEKKLENVSTKEFVLNKFKLKPEMKVKEIFNGKESLKNIKNFVDKFKSSTDEILKDPIITEKHKIENGQFKKKKPGKHVQMNLALGVLDIIPKQDLNQESMLDNIVSTKKMSNQNLSDDNLDLSQHPFLNDKADQEILKFLLNNNNKKKRTRIHKIKNNKIK